jgi:hypothetical protein
VDFSVLGLGFGVPVSGLWFLGQGFWVRVKVRVKVRVWVLMVRVWG